MINGNTYVQASIHFMILNCGQRTCLKSNVYFYLYEMLFKLLLKKDIIWIKL